MKKYKILYFIKKMYSQLLETLEMRKYKISQNIFYKTNYPKKINKILFFLDNSYYAHLGDQFFFEPLMNNLNNSNFTIEVSPTKVMESYFLELGYTVNRTPNFKDYDLIITRSDFYNILKKVDNVLYFQTTNLKEKLCDTMIKQVYEVLKIDLNSEYTNKPRSISSKENKYNKILDPKRKYVIYSNYIDSGGFLNNNKNFEELETICKIKRKEGFKIIHIGSEKNLREDDKKYDYIDYDFRGKTSVLDLFYLISNEKVEEYLGFDGFLMHLFFITDKKVNVCIRNKLTQSRKEKIIKYVNPPFEGRLSNKIRYVGAKL